MNKLKKDFREQMRNYVRERRFDGTESQCNANINKNMKT